LHGGGATQALGHCRIFGGIFRYLAYNLSEMKLIQAENKAITVALEK